MAEPKQHARKWWAGGVTLVLALMLAAAVLTLTSCSSQQVLTRATSADGSWAVVVTGERTLSGSIEVDLRVHDAQDESVSVFVIDLCSDWAHAKQKYTQVTFTNGEAHVRDRVIRKADYFKNP